MLGRPLDFHPNQSPPPAKWIVEPILEADTVTLFTGDSGAGKSYISITMMLAIVRGEPWVGHDTMTWPEAGQGKVLYIDNENPARQVDKRLRAFGCTVDDWSRIRYFNRIGVQLGSGEWLERTLAEIDDFKPNLVVVDTATSATTAVANDGDSVSRLYAQVLRPMSGPDCAVMLQHHERKPTQGQPRDSRNAALGTVHWRTQADTMLTIERRGEPFRRGNTQKFAVRLSMPKNRDGENMNLDLAICSEHEGKRVVRGWLERREERR